ncbi:OLC1v1019404C1 [Oldenlandia corymbosa var. corymbosa]|uniref:OLC1v1019404C1 n=1 Tax=Oldenlandia corymbosa var. corymbosa TaxID=529605 RepID=A0AAV1EE12_OLDCO|nr:OLC1v1019404C1 [Oldenlandia corymbosa var. corymbosa]
MQNLHQPPSATATATATTTAAATTTLKLSTPCILLTTTFISLFLIYSFSASTSPSLPPRHPSLFPPNSPHRLLFLNAPAGDTSGDAGKNPLAPPTPPSIAYLISGSCNDTGRIFRLLLAIYHPKNTYLLHLDFRASQDERDSLARKIESFPLFKAAQNVNVVGRADVVYRDGSSSVSSILHGASILMRISDNWDWFINLSVDDYPLVTQDDLLHILSYLPRDLNFVNHTSYIGWIESRKLKPIIVDPGLYLTEENEVFYATQKRPLPDAFHLFTGSSSAILSRKFIEFNILGTDNLPRTVLMYLANTPASESVYFPTILCNSRQFNRTTINHSLHYVSLNLRKDPIPLNMSYYNDLVRSGSAFASPFLPNDPILDRIDKKILHRAPEKPVPGGWCLGDPGRDVCKVWGDADVLRPGKGAKRLEKRLVGLLSRETLQSHQCVVDNS